MTYRLYHNTEVTTLFYLHIRVGGDRKPFDRSKNIFLSWYRWTWTLMIFDIAGYDPTYDESELLQKDGMANLD